MDKKTKQKKGLKKPEELNEEVEVALPDDLNELLKEYREVSGEMPRLQVIKDIKRVDKSKDIVDKSRDVTLTADSLIEVSAPDKTNKEVAAAILATALVLGQNVGTGEVTTLFKNVKDAMEKEEMEENKP